MALQTYNEILTELLDSVEAIRADLNTHGIDGSEPMNTWPSQIDNLVNTLSKDKEQLSKEVTTLNEKISTDNNQFNNIYDAIIEKNPSEQPVKDDRDTYPSAIRSISGGAGDFEINYCYYLFGISADGTNTPYRYNNVKDLLPHCKNMTNCNNMFAGCQIPSGETLEVDITSVTFNDEDAKSTIFPGVNTTSGGEITLKLITDGISRSAFNNCNKQKSGYINAEIKDINNKKLKYLYNTFADAYNIKSIKIDADTSEVTNMYRAFYQFNKGCSGNILTEIDLSNLNLDKINSLQEAFYYANTLTSINLGNIDLNKVTTMYQCFYYNSKLNSLIYNDSVLSMVNMYECFYYCTSLQSIKLNIDDDFSNNTLNRSKYRLLSQCTSLETVETDLDDGWKICGVAGALFAGCKKLKNIPKINIIQLGNTGVGDYVQYMFQSCELLEEVEINMVKPDNQSVDYRTGNYLFDGCKALRKAKLNNMFELLTGLNYSFRNCSSLEKLEINNGDVICTSTSTASLTLDLSASAVFDAEDFINRLGANNTGKTRTIKLNSTVYDALSQETITMAAEKNYTLSK